MVNATRFRLAHQGDWERLEELVTRLEKKSLGHLDDDDLLALPALYRTTLSSLSIARDTSLDRALVTYLEQLCTRAYFQIYGVQTPARRQVADFFRTGWPVAARDLWKETLVCSALMVLSAVIGYLLVSGDPGWFYSIIPAELAGGRDPAASAEFLRGTLYDSQESLLTTFATYLFTHNSQVAILSFALGFAFAVPTVLLMLYNGLMLGAIYAVFAAKGLGPNLAGWLMIHGTTELLAIAIAGAAGLRIGTAVAFPGRLTRAALLVKAGRSAATAMIGVVVMLAAAGLLEGIGRQTITSDVFRFLIGWSMLTFWVLYLYVLGGRKRMA
nr:stage II sporulation protein M [Sphingomonas arenae]